MKKNNILGIIMLATTAIIWGFAFVAQVMGMEHLRPFTFNAIRFLIGAISLIPVILIMERDFKNKEKNKQTLIASLLGGITLFFAAACQQIGADITKSAGVSGFITALYTVMTPLFYLIFFRRKTPSGVWTGAVLSIVGLFMLCVKDGKISLGIGELMLFFGSFFFMLHLVVIDLYVEKVNPIQFSCLHFLVSGVLNIAAAFIFEAGAFSFDSVAKAYIALLYCGILSAGVAYTTQILGQKHSSNPTSAAIILSTESLFSAIGGVVFGTDSIPPLGYVGCGLIFVGVLLSQLPEGFFKKAFSKNPEHKNPNINR